MRRFWAVTKCVTITCEETAMSKVLNLPEVGLQVFKNKVKDNSGEEKNQASVL